MTALNTIAVTDAQRLLLLSSYLPFFLLPLFMTLDMAWRISKVIDYRKVERKDTAGRIKRQD